MSKKLLLPNQKFTWMYEMDGVIELCCKSSEDFEEALKHIPFMNKKDIMELVDCTDITQFTKHLPQVEVGIYNTSKVKKILTTRYTVELMNFLKKYPQAVVMRKLTNKKEVVLLSSEPERILDNIKKKSQCGGYTLTDRNTIISLIDD